MATIPRSPVFTRIERQFPHFGSQFYVSPNPLLNNLKSKDKFFAAPGEAPRYDYPNPRGYPFPLEDRGYLNTLDLELLGKDKFFAAPGEAPRYDWPNPDTFIKRSNENRTWIDTLTLTLLGKDKFFAAPGEAPRYDYPNPVQPRRWIGLYDCSIGTNRLLYPAAVVQAPFHQYDYQNPQIARRNPDWTLSTNPNQYPSGKPFKQDDYPNPRGYVPAVDVRSWTLSSDPNRYQSGQPFNQSDWPNPRGYVQPADIRNWTFSSDPNKYLQPFNQDEWPNPRGASRSIELYGFTGGLNTNLVVVVAPPKPFAQTDWQNPRGYAQPSAWTFSTDPKLYPSGKPFLQGDWPNPVRATNRHQDWTVATNPNRYQSGAPFNQSDYPNPRGAARGIDLYGFTGSTNASLFILIVPPKPFAQTDWPNPQGYRRNPDFQLSTDPAIYRSGKPFLQGDWPNPTRATNRHQDWILETDPTLYRSGKPFLQSEWPNPLAFRPIRIDWQLNWNCTHLPPVITVWPGIVMPGALSALRADNTTLLVSRLLSADLDILRPSTDSISVERLKPASFSVSRSQHLDLDKDN